MHSQSKSTTPRTQSESACFQFQETPCVRIVIRRARMEEEFMKSRAQLPCGISNFARLHPVRAAEAPERVAAAMRTASASSLHPQPVSRSHPKRVQARREKARVTQPEPA